MPTIRCGTETCQVPQGTTVGELRGRFTQVSVDAVLALWNGTLVDFETEIEGDGELVWKGISSREGHAAYQRSLIFLLVQAVQELFPGARVEIRHSLGRGLYGVLTADHPITHRDLTEVEEYMHRLVRARRPFRKLAHNRRTAINICENLGFQEEAQALENVLTEQIYLYQAGSCYDFYLGPLVPDAGCLEVFDLMHYAPGFLLRCPDRYAGMKLPEYQELSLFSRVFFEATEWGNRVGCRYVADLNEAIANGRIHSIVAIAEALHEKNLARIADEVANRKPEVRLITIAGPSSAGKTTMTKRLCVQLEVNAISPVMISLDDYYLPRSQRRIDTSGKVDYESVEALDLALLETQMGALLAGDPVRLARFNFVDGERYFDQTPTRLIGRQPIIMEGLHALNPVVSRMVPAYQRLHIFIGALTQQTISDHNRISTTDTRLLRRLVRDRRCRAHEAEETLAGWDRVRQGEEKYIFPYQERADIIFNTALLYELPVLKMEAEPLLSEIPPSSAQYSEAQRLLRFLAIFAPLERDIVPANSILREFIGS